MNESVSKRRSGSDGRNGDGRCSSVSSSVSELAGISVGESVRDSMRSRSGDLTYRRFPMILLGVYISGIFFAILAKVAHSAEITASALGVNFSGSESKIGVGSGYHQELTTWLQFGASMEYERLSHGVSSLSVWNARIGPTFNMDGAIPQAFYLFAGVVKRHGTGTQPSLMTEPNRIDPNAIGGFVEFGKRFQMGTFSYRPSVSILAAGGLHYRINFLAFSAFF